MYVQVVNKTKTSFNTIRVEVDQLNPTTMSIINKRVKAQGWNIQDCSVTELRDELVDTKYRGADGKNIPTGQKQYKTRAKSRGNLNKKSNQVDIKKVVEAAKIIK